MVKNWIDWMKVLGMFSIIWGHCFPVLFSDFLYAFNVPLFFFLSGYLSKQETENDTFWKKIINRLWIPYLMLSLLKALPHLISKEGLWPLLAILTGFHTLHGVAGCGKLWFVYTLIILKIVFQFMKNTPKTKGFVLVISFLGAITCQYIEQNLYWAVTNSFLAMPWFLLGNEYRNSKSETIISDFFSCHSTWLKCGLVCFLLSAIYIVSYFNGSAYMYVAEYGNYLFLFFIGGILGIFCILLISNILDKYKSKSLRMLSIGTIVILAYHQDVNHPLLKLVHQNHFNPLIEDVATFLCSVITLLAFIPIVYIISRYLPIVIGNRKLN